MTTLRFAAIFAILAMLGVLAQADDIESRTAPAAQQLRNDLRQTTDLHQTGLHRTEANVPNRDLMRAWQRSLIPLMASQSLDAASSYGYRELNPLLADSNGAFGVRATTVKFSVVFALVGIEYVLAKRSPKAARIFAKLNWSSSALTTGLAVHNYVVR